MNHSLFNHILLKNSRAAEMRKRAVTFDWQIASSDGEWGQLEQRAPTRLEQRRLPRWLGEVLLLMLVIGGVSCWHWYTTQAEFQQAQTELLTSVHQEARAAPPAWSVPTPVAQLEPLPAEYALLVAVKPKLSGAQSVPRVRLLELRGEQALVQVLTPAGAHTPAYRQTQFYQHTTAGWQRTAPNATGWGPEQELATPSFRWRYQEKDAPVIARVAPQLESIYTTLRRNFGLANVPQRAKLVIAVRVTQPAGYVSPWFGAAEEYVVTSPAFYRAPAELTDAEILAQSLTLPLLNTVLTQAQAHYQLHFSWQPLLNGLRLWQFWEIDLPLAGWGPEVTEWLYAELTRTDVTQRLGLPPHYAELCAAHTLWLPSPLQIGIPLTCNELDQRAGALATTGGPKLVLHLMFRSAPTAGRYAEAFVEGVGERSQTVALASLLEYAVVTYGRERLPILLASLGQHVNWETLLPAVYGVSAAEFEAAWQTYLVTQYGG